MNVPSTAPGASVLPDAEATRILRARAAALATRVRPPDEGVAHMNVLAFRLSSETFAVELEYVGEVRPFRGLTALPGAPASVLGVTNVRGSVVSVLDLRAILHLKTDTAAEPRNIIVMRNDGMEFGLPAEDLIGIEAVARDRLQATLPTLAGVREEWLKGVTVEGTVVLDGARMLVDGNTPIT